MNCITLEPELKLFTPGPTNIPNRVAQAAAMVNYHHRTASFSHVLRDTLENMKPLFGTSGAILPIHATGRGALEGVYNNVFAPGDKVLSVANGSFGEMAVKAMQKNGINSIACFADWSANVDLDDLEQMILREKPVGLTAVWNDTSNGLVNPIRELGQLARKYNLLFVVDTVSALGCMPFEFDNWGVDVAVVASQKGLMSATGMSFAAVSDRAMQACASHPSHDFYINLPDIMKSVTEKYETPGSTPVSIVLMVNEALHMLQEEGLDHVFLRHRALSMGTKAAMEALGCSLYPVGCKYRSDSLSVAKLPDGMSPADVVGRMQDGYGLLIGKGLKKTASENIRIAHMGYCYVQDMLQCITVLEAAFRDLGREVAFGTGVAAFMQAYQAELQKAGQ